MNYREIIQSSSFGELKKDDFSEEGLYEALIEEYCDKKGTAWVSVSNKILNLSEQFGTQTKSIVKEFLAEAKKELATERKKKAVSITGSPISNFIVTDDNPLQLTPEELERTRCENYVMDENGLYQFTPGGGRKHFCHTPLTITMQFQNKEGNGALYNIRYRKIVNGEPMIIDKAFPAEIISSKNAILKLSRDGILVSSVNASLVVDYLQEVIGTGERYGMPTGISTEKFGWTENGRFSPYDKDTRFDGEDKHQQLYESATSVRGSSAEYFKHMREIRAKRRLELNVLIASAMGSVMMDEYITTMPFMLHIAGGTDSGKTLELRIALSQIGNPMEGYLLGDYRGTKAGIESRADCLNNLPLALDDTSKMSAEVMKNFEMLVYDLCSSLGRTLGNKEGGNRRIKTWHNIIFSTGEDRPSTYCSKGGALNRIIEITTNEGMLFDKPEQEIRFFQRNHGHVIRKFIEALRTVGQEEVNRKYEEYKESIKQTKHDLLAKQLQPLALILTADEILTDYVYKDGIYLRDELEKLSGMLKSKEEVSDGARAYDYLKDMVAGNQRHFYMDDPTCDEAQGEQWGWAIGDYTYIPNSWLKKILAGGGFNSGKFIEWAVANDITYKDSNGQSPVHNLKRVGNKQKTQRAWQILIRQEEIEKRSVNKENEAFITDIPETIDETLPFV